jgi:hypothetical protein
MDALIQWLSSDSSNAGKGLTNPPTHGAMNPIPHGIARNGLLVDGFIP